MIVDLPALPPAFTSGEVPAICIAYAASKFEIPPSLILAVLKAEGGRTGMENRNTNGTYDLGPMQINTTWLPLLRGHGVERAALRDDGCLNVWVGAWILRSALNSTHHWWRGVGRYHSATMQPGRDLNGRYAERVWTHLQRIDRLEASWWGLPGLSRITTATTDRLANESRRTDP